jgi:D-sedoheptulose 7-phosphate isomerase
MVSGSGTSKNVVRAAEWARAKGLTLVGLTGFDGGTLGRMADVHINVPSRNYGVIEDVHMSIGHIVTQTLQARVARELER